MKWIGVGSRVRIDIPDETDPDHYLHGEHGLLVKEIEDAAGESTGDDKDNNLYRVKLDTNGEKVDVRARDIRPPIDD